MKRKFLLMMHYDDKQFRHFHWCDLDMWLGIDSVVGYFSGICFSSLSVKLLFACLCSFLAQAMLSLCDGMWQKWSTYYAENGEFSWCQLYCHWQYQRHSIITIFQHCFSRDVHSCGWGKNILYVLRFQNLMCILPLSLLCHMQCHVILGHTITRMDWKNLHFIVQNFPIQSCYDMYCDLSNHQSLLPSRYPGFDTHIATRCHQFSSTILNYIISTK